MTFHLAQFRLKSVGERSARFSDLTLDMTAPDGDGLSSPSDSVIWLRNGGGKSSLLSLFYAVLLPRVYDFMGREAKRALTDYVDSGDTSHTVTVWQPVNSDRDVAGVGGALVVGAVYEWVDLRRPVDSDNARDRFNASYYAFYCVPGVLDADTIPFMDSDGQPLRRAAFLAELRAIADRARGEAELAITERQFEWAATLNARGIDPDLFRTQKTMNHVEGGVEDLFRFASAREFVNFLLDLTVAPDEAGAVAERVSAIATLVASKPTKQTEQDFCLAAADVLATIHDRAVDVGNAEEELDTASAYAMGLAGQFETTLRALDAEMGVLDTRLTTWTDERETNATDRSVANDTVFLYTLRAAHLRIEEATRLVKTAEQTSHDTSLRAQAWAATAPLAELASLRESLAQAQQLAAAENEDIAPLRRTHDDHAATLLTRLAAVAGTERDTANRERDSAKALAGDAQLLRKHEKEQRNLGREADQRATLARSKLETLDGDIKRAVTDGFLPAGVSPAVHQTTLQTEAAAVDTELAQVRGRRAARPARRTELTGETHTISTDIVRVDGERGRVMAAIDAFAERADRLASDSRLRELAEATDESPLDPWSEGDQLTHALHANIERADADLIRGRADHFADEDLVHEQETTGVLPSSSDAIAVATLLANSGIPAETGWHHLRSNYPPDQCRALLDSPDLARLGCGVVVATDHLDAARTALLAADKHTRSLVGLYTASTAAQLASTVPHPNEDVASWTGLHPGMVNETIADETIVRVKDELRAYAKLAADLESQRNTDRSLLDVLTRFLSDCPDGHLTQLRSEVTSHDATLDELATRKTTAEEQLFQLEKDEVADSTGEQELTARHSTIERAFDRIADLAARTEQASGWREHLATAEQDAVTAYGNAEQANLAAQSKDGEVADARGRAQAADQRADSLSTEAARIQYLDAGYTASNNPDLGQSVTLDILRQRQREAQRTYEVRTASSVYADRVRTLSERVSDIQQQVDRLDAAVCIRAEDLLASPEGQDTQRRADAINAAQQAVTAAAKAQGEAHATLTSAQQRYTEARERRRDVPRRNEVPQEPTTVAEADALLADWEQRNAAAQARRIEIDQAIDGLSTSKQTCENRRQVFTVLRSNLNLPEGTEPPQHASPYPHSADQAQADRDEAAARIHEANARWAEARDKLKDAVGRARTTGSQYPTVTVTAKDRLLHDHEDILARSAAALAENLRLRATTISDELAGIVRDQDIVATSLVNLVKTTFDTLHKAERYSLLPSSLGAWAGQKMLRITFTVPPSDADMRTYVNRVIDRRINEGVKPEGMPLLKDAVHEVVGPRGFIVKVLKPSEDTTGTREDITRLSKWSGGEKLTVCVALYCTIAALRAANSGRKDRAGGVLVLDNPIGRASHGSLVKLQRAVAAHHKVQLIYTTGVKDPDAVSRFPNVVRLDNRTGRGSRSRHYIVQAQADTDPNTGHVDGIRVAHTDSAAHVHVVSSAEGPE
ncbi:MAG: hypothetical protein GX440_05365 [Propionibacterium sp.]|nr:hypothetical protein [Propionibacterium sp.]